MASLNITEYSNFGTVRDSSGLTGVPIAKEPATAVQNVTFTTATASSVFNPTTKLVRLISDADCYVLFGGGTATSSNAQRLKADVEYWRSIDSGDTLSVYDGTS